MIRKLLDEKKRKEEEERKKQASLPLDVLQKKAAEAKFQAISIEKKMEEAKQELGKLELTLKK